MSVEYSVDSNASTFRTEAPYTVGVGSALTAQFGAVEVMTAEKTGDERRSSNWLLSTMIAGSSRKEAMQRGASVGDNIFIYVTGRAMALALMPNDLHSFKFAPPPRIIEVLKVRAASVIMPLPPPSKVRRYWTGSC
jgi:hypothetical protein